MDEYDKVMTDENICSFLVGMVKKLLSLYSQHYLIMPLATIGLIAIILVLIKLWRWNKEITKRVNDFEKQLDKENS